MRFGHSHTPWYDQKQRSEIQEIGIQHPSWNGCQLSVLREDALHAQISGNKLRKLKYNIRYAVQQGYTGLISFGGAYSNHIVALSAACQMAGLSSIGYIRGEELAGKPLNPSLERARAMGMELRFIDRRTYRQKQDPGFIKTLIGDNHGFFIVPEGGSNALALEGCGEIWDSIPEGFDLLCLSVGTGGTLAGLLEGKPDGQLAIRGYTAVGGIGRDTIARMTSRTDYQWTDAYTFGGYAKIDRELVRFMNTFYSEYGLLLDPVYTAKLFYGIQQDVKTGIIPKNTRILAIHTGGLQGIAGMNLQLLKRDLPQIETP